MRWPVTALVFIVRGTPLLMVVFWAYFFLPTLTGHKTDQFTTMLIALVVFDGVYLAEIVRAGIVGRRILLRKNRDHGGRQIVDVLDESHGFFTTDVERSDCSWKQDRVADREDRQLVTELNSLFVLLACRALLLGHVRYLPGGNELLSSVLSRRFRRS